MSEQSDAPQIIDSDWDSIVEIEGVFNTSKDLKTLMQYEHLYNGAFGQNHQDFEAIQSKLHPGQRYA